MVVISSRHARGAARSVERAATRGGTLLIGVHDSGVPVGLDPDFVNLRKPSKDDTDLFGLHLNNLIVESMGGALALGVGLPPPRPPGSSWAWVARRGGSERAPLRNAETPPGRPRSHSTYGIERAHCTSCHRTFAAVDFFDPH